MATTHFCKYLVEIQDSLLRSNVISLGADLEEWTEHLMSKSHGDEITDVGVFLQNLIEIHNQFQDSVAKTSFCDVYTTKSLLTLPQPSDTNQQLKEPFNQLGVPFNQFHRPNYDHCLFLKEMNLQYQRSSTISKPVSPTIKFDLTNVKNGCNEIAKKQERFSRDLGILKEYFLDPMKEQYECLGFPYKKAVNDQYQPVDRLLDIALRISNAIGTNLNPEHVIKCFLGYCQDLAILTKEYSANEATNALTKALYNNNATVQRFIEKQELNLEKETTQSIDFKNLVVAPVQYFMHMKNVLAFVYENGDPKSNSFELFEKAYKFCIKVIGETDDYVDEKLRVTYLVRLRGEIPDLNKLNLGDYYIKSVQAIEFDSRKNGWLCLFSNCLVFLVKDKYGKYNCECVFDLSEIKTAILELSKQMLVLWKHGRNYYLNIGNIEEKKDFVELLQQFTETCETKKSRNRVETYCSKTDTCIMYFDIYNDPGKVQAKNSDTALYIFENDDFEISLKYGNSS